MNITTRMLCELTQRLVDKYFKPFSWGIVTGIIFSYSLIICQQISFIKNIILFILNLFTTIPHTLFITGTVLTVLFCNTKLPINPNLLETSCQLFSCCGEFFLRHVSRGGMRLSSTFFCFYFFSDKLVESKLLASPLPISFLGQAIFLYFVFSTVEFIPAGLRYYYNAVGPALYVITVFFTCYIQ